MVPIIHGRFRGTFLYNLAKVGGTLAGLIGDRLPRRAARALSLHRYHWEE